MKPDFGSVTRRVLARVRGLLRGVHPPDLAELARRAPVKLHLGCGDIHLDGWINIDGNSRSAADVVMDFRHIGGAFPAASVDEVMMIHSLSYLRLWEVRDLLAALQRMLKPGGRFTAEFPDVAKCAVAITRAGQDVAGHLNAVRALYAFDLEQIAKRRLYLPYAFGWAAWHLTIELQAAGFSAVETRPPLTHGALTWRDSRVEATK